MLSIRLKGNSPLGFTSEVITLLHADLIKIHSYTIMKKKYAQHQNEKKQPSKFHLGCDNIITCKHY